MDLSGIREKLVQQHGEAERETKALQAAFEAERQAFSEALRGKAEHAAKVKEEVTTISHVITISLTSSLDDQ